MCPRTPHSSEWLLALKIACEIQQGVEMDSFYDQCYRYVRDNEGGYLTAGMAANLQDAGGETYKGIARNFHPKWSGWTIIDSLNAKDASITEIEKHVELSNLVASFFKTEYWNKMQLDTLSQLSKVLTLELFDTAINFGVIPAVRFLQRALNLLSTPPIVVDGMLGAGTLSVLTKLIHARAEDVLALSMNAFQIAAYASMTESQESKRKFYAGWVRNRGRDPYKALASILKS